MDQRKTNATQPPADQKTPPKQQLSPTTANAADNKNAEIVDAKIQREIKQYLIHLNKILKSLDINNLIPEFNKFGNYLINTFQTGDQEKINKMLKPYVDTFASIALPNPSLLLGITSATTSFYLDNKFEKAGFVMTSLMLSLKVSSNSYIYLMDHNRLDDAFHNVGEKIGAEHGTAVSKRLDEIVKSTMGTAIKSFNLHQLPIDGLMQQIKSIDAKTSPYECGEIFKSILLYSRQFAINDQRTMKQELKAILEALIENQPSLRTYFKVANIQDLDQFTIIMHFSRLILKLVEDKMTADEKAKFAPINDIWQRDLMDNGILRDQLASYDAEKAALKTFVLNYSQHGYDEKAVIGICNQFKENPHFVTQRGPGSPSAAGLFSPVDNTKTCETILKYIGMKYPEFAQEIYNTLIANLENKDANMSPKQFTSAINLLKLLGKAPLALAILENGPPTINIGASHFPNDTYIAGALKVIKTSYQVAPSKSEPALAAKKK
jgi:hypothetical protein